MASLNDLDGSAGNGMTVGTQRSRLAQSMARTREPEKPYTFQESDASLARYRESEGIDNPYGRGLAAYEPNTVLFEEYDNAYKQVQADKQQDDYDAAVKKANTIKIEAPAIEGTGKVAKMINAAMGAVGKPYVWGGTSLASGVDCSGLIFAAAKAAGIDIPRYRAKDYLTMGQQMDAKTARPGDLVVWDNPNTDTDHVGIYLGDGKVLQAPQSGETVKVSKVWNHPPPQYRRVFGDALFGNVATPDGGTATAYNGRLWSASNTWSSTVGPYQQSTNTVRRTSTVNR